MNTPAALDDYLLDLLEVLGSGTYEAGVPAVWSQGDFNYDGVVDVLDAADFITTELRGHWTEDEWRDFTAAGSRRFGW